MIDSITSKSSRKNLTLSQELNFYDQTESGLYIFKPAADKKMFDFRPTVREYDGDLVTVIRADRENYFQQQIVVHKKGELTKAPLIEITAKTGEFKDLGFALNVNDFSDHKEFFNHDSNDFVKREFKPIDHITNTGRNIYPSVNGYAVKDNNTVFGIVNNYPTGCGYVNNEKDQVH